MKKIAVLTILLLVMSFAAIANAGPFDYLVGDKDGFGFGAPDQGLFTNPWPAYPPPAYDGRSAAEQAATNGAQLTDSYSTLFPGYSPPGIGYTGSVIIPIPVGQPIIDASFVVAMADFQASTFPPPISANFNGIPESFNFSDGFEVAATRTFVLSPAEVAAANAAGRFICNFDHGTTSVDFIAFDWFELSGNKQSTAPIPGALLLLGSGLVGMIGFGLGKKSS